MTRNQNHDDASSGITIKTCDNSIGVVPWSDLTHDVLFLVMMKLGVVDFLVFSGVCKSWRSLTLSNRNKFMAFKAPMSICISTTDANDKECHLKDFEGRKFKTTIPHSSGRTCVGLTCGYLILFGEKSNDFWLVNPITSHKLRFPDVPFALCLRLFKAILVFSPSISGWVFVISNPFHPKIWISIAGKGEWTHVLTQTEGILFRILDLHVFKGKIYALDSDSRLSEVRLFPTPKVTLLEIKNFPKPDFIEPVFVSLGENLCVMELISKNAYKIINFTEVEGVSLEQIRDEFALFFSKSMPLAPVISDLGSQYKRYAVTVEGPKRKIFYANMWYFFHDCLKVNLLQD